MPGKFQTEELGELQLMESKRVKHDLATKPHSRVSEWILGDALVHWGYYRLGGLNNQHLLLTVLGAGKSKIKLPVSIVKSW